MTRHRILVLALVLLPSAVACGGAVSPVDTSTPSQSTTAEGTPPGATTPPSDTPPVRAETTPLDPQLDDGTNAVVTFHRGTANMIVDRLNGVLALREHTPGSDAFFEGCGTFTPVFADGTVVRLTMGSLPTGAGGSMAVKDVVVKRIDSNQLVLHVTMQNGTELDDTWTSGLTDATGSLGLPKIATCQP